MERITFESRLWTAARQAVEFAREYVSETLPEEVVFHVYPNTSCDANLRAGEEIFPGDSLPDGESLGPWSIWQVAEFLWRDEKVPEWVDVLVQGEDGIHTEVALQCCGRFTARDELLYYPGRDTRPFAVKSPYYPPDWESPEVSGRFSIHWRKERFGTAMGSPRTSPNLGTLLNWRAWFKS